ncbi:hypothetical protein B0H13DRAFT_2058071 [Mycena leptocephala]|nr:hypothetical protein B0H13DRAFT_2058071 [Mycena leptocephala]
MAITRGTSARTASPTPSENSDMYYEDFNNRYASLSPAPSQTADALGWGSDTGEHRHDDTPTPQPARAPSPASVVVLSEDEFPPLPAPTPATVTKPRAKASKSKGKGKVKAAPTAAETHTSDNDDPFLAADTAQAVAASLGLSLPLDHATAGASSSRCPAAAGAGSPNKRLRSNSAGDAGPAPYAEAAAASATTPIAIPAAARDAAPVTTPATPALALTAPLGPAPVAAPPIITPVTPPVPAPAAVPAPAPVAAPVPDPDHGLPPMWLTADGNPPRSSYFPTPAGGLPAIVYSEEQLFHDVPADLLGMYEEVAFPKFFLFVSGGNGAVMKTHGLIREAIGNYINIDPADFTLGTPPTAANGTSPAPWLTADIPAPLAQAIVDARIISSTDITLYPLPYNMPIIGFVGVFAGFTLPNSTAGADVARAHIRAAVSNNGEIAQFVQTHRDAFSPQVSAEQAWERFLTSVSVQGIILIVNSTNTVAWRLYVEPPTTVREHWSRLCCLFGKLQIMTALHGTARLQRAFRCHICPSIDHPTALCPLPNLPGWLGPTPATITALEDASRAAAAKAHEQMRINAFAGAGSANPRSVQGRHQGGSGNNPRRDGEGKKGSDHKGKGKRRERDDFF